MKKELLFVISILLSTTLFAQVGIGTTTPAPSSVLDLTANDKGFLPPRLDNSQRIAISSPVEGLTIYNVESKCLEIWNGDNWFNVCTNTIINTFHTEIVEIFNPITERIWMDRNLGANQAATSSTHEAAFGDLYQWGRAADGHEKIFREAGDEPTSGIYDGVLNGFPSSAVASGAWDGLFITSNGFANNDWLGLNKNDNLWQGTNGVNNPCPDEYRLPTHAEFADELGTWTSNNDVGAYQSIKLTSTPIRLTDGTFLSLTSLKLGLYWTSTVSGNNIRIISFQQNNSSINPVSSRAEALPVRCIKEN